MFLRFFGLYCSACFGSLSVSILCTCCSHFSWYCFISFTMFCAPGFCLIHWFFSLSSFVIPIKCLKNFICAASKRCSSLFFSTQASLPNFNAALAVILLLLLFIFFSSRPYCYLHCSTQAPLSPTEGRLIAFTVLHVMLIRRLLASTNAVRRIMNPLFTVPWSRHTWCHWLIYSWEATLYFHINGTLCVCVG